MEDRIEQDVVLAFYAAGADPESQDCDPEVCEEINDCISNELYSFYSADAARQRGVKTQSFVHRFKPNPNELTLEQRKKMVQAAKEKSHCRK